MFSCCVPCPRSQQSSSGPQAGASRREVWTSSIRPALVGLTESDTVETEPDRPAPSILIYRQVVANLGRQLFVARLQARLLHILWRALLTDAISLLAWLGAQRSAGARNSMELQHIGTLRHLHSCRTFVGVMKRRYSFWRSDGAPDSAGLVRFGLSNTRQRLHPGCDSRSSERLSHR